MSQNKYVMLAANSSLKGKSDFNKFHKAMQLKGCIDKVRIISATLGRAMRSSAAGDDDVAHSTSGVACGGEKNEDEADAVPGAVRRYGALHLPLWW